MVLMTHELNNNKSYAVVLTVSQTKNFLENKSHFNNWDKILKETRSQK